MSHQMAYESAIQDYEQNMQMLCGDPEMYIEPEDMVTHHFKCIAIASTCFMNHPKFGDNHYGEVWGKKLNEVS